MDLNLLPDDVAEDDEDYNAPLENEDTYNAEDDVQPVLAANSSTQYNVLTEVTYINGNTHGYLLTRIFRIINPELTIRKEKGKKNRLK